MVKKIEINIWIDGGWGLDALLEETRTHNDIDLFVEVMFYKY